MGLYGVRRSDFAVLVLTSERLGVINIGRHLSPKQVT